MRSGPNACRGLRIPSLPAWTFALLLGVAAAVCAQGPAPLTWGTYMATDGHATHLEWKTQNLKASETADALHLEVEPKTSGTATTVPLALAPLRLYTITMTCRRGPGTRLDVFVKWLDAENKSNQRLMVWQLPDRFRVNWWPLSALKTTYAQRFCLPPGATQPTLQVAMRGHPDAGYNYFDLYDLNLTRGPEVPYGPRLGPNLLATGTMDAADANGMALGWTFWGANPDAKVLDQDPDGRPARASRAFLAIPAGKNCILAGGTIPVQPGRAYRFSFWVRGQGDLSPGLQSLEPDQGQRVADAQQRPFHVEAADWQQLSFDWFAESLWIDSANPFMGIGTQTELDLDDFTFQLVEP